MTDKIILEGNTGTGWQFGGTCKTIEEAQEALKHRQENYPEAQWRLVYPTESASPYRTEHSKQPWQAFSAAYYHTMHGPSFDIPCKRFMDSRADSQQLQNIESVVAQLNLYPQLVEALRGFKQALAMLEKHDPGTADAIRSEHRAVLAQALV
jgi:hypothetical protein